MMQILRWNLDYLPRLKEKLRNIGRRQAAGNFQGFMTYHTWKNEIRRENMFGNLLVQNVGKIGPKVVEIFERLAVSYPGEIPKILL